MSRKNKFKNRNKVVDKSIVGKVRLANTDLESYVKKDLFGAILIIVLFVGMMAGLYYYDKQSGILQVASQKLMNLF